MTRKQKAQRWASLREALGRYRWARRQAVGAVVAGKPVEGGTEERLRSATVDIAECVDRLDGKA